MSLYARELEVLSEAVREAGDLLVAETRRPGGPRGHKDKAPIDLEIESLLLQRIAEHWPQDHVVSEETGGRMGSSQRAFIIDPHDGTSAFLSGRRESSISLALVDDTALVLGIIYAPLPGPLTGSEGLFVSWAQGGVLQRNGEPVEPVPGEALGAESVALVSARIGGETLARNAELLQPARLEPCASIATRLALVAVGEADVGYTVRNRLHGWDFAAGQALLQAVGGDVVGPGGRAIRWRTRESDGASLRAYIGARSTRLATHVARRLDVLL